MPSVTTQKLVDRAAAAADMHDNFVSPTIWMDWASQERYALELFMARSGWPMDYATATITVSGSEGGEFQLPQVTYGTGPSAVTVSPAIMAIVAVHQIESNGLRRLRYSDAVSFLRQLPGSPVYSADDVSLYRMRRSIDSLIFNFYPDPRVGSQFLVTYVPMPNRLALEAATLYDVAVNYPMGWEERIVLGMARRALEKEESDSKPVMTQMREIDQLIEELSWSKVMSEAPTVRNVDRLPLEMPSRESWAWV